MSDVQTQPTKAVAFYHEKGFVPAYQQARKFVGQDGRVATIPDIIDARLHSEPGSPAWERYFTTMSAEFVGYSSRTGRPIIIVAHGVGPLSTLEGVKKAYSYQYNDSDRNVNGGRITLEEFRKLEEGGYGPVSIVDLEQYWTLYRYPLIESLTLRQARRDPLVKARLGSKYREYLVRHHQIAWKWRQESKERFRSKSFHTFSVRDNGNGSYMSKKILDHHLGVVPGMAIAHLLSIGQLQNTSHSGENAQGQYLSMNSLLSEVSCHGWHDGTRFIGIQGQGEVTEISQGADDLGGLMAKHWAKIMRPTRIKPSKTGFFTLMDFGDQKFTMYPKQGESMDSYAPEFRVTSITPVEEGATSFRTRIGGYHGFFRYGLSEVKRIAPRGANAYTIGDVEIDWRDGNPEFHVAEVKFFRVEVDQSQRLLRSEEVRNDYDLMMSLLDEKAA